MLQHEFEKLTGTDVPAETYCRIDRVYLRCGDDIDKQTFCKKWKEGDSLAIMEMLAAEVEREGKILDQYRQEAEEGKIKKAKMAVALIKAASQYKDSSLKRLAIDLVGIREVVTMSLENGEKLSDDECDFLLELLQ